MSIRTTMQDLNAALCKFPVALHGVSSSQRDLSILETPT